MSTGPIEDKFAHAQIFHLKAFMIICLTHKCSIRSRIGVTIRAYIASISVIVEN